nr:chemotaxis protein CheD [Aminomonas paucivorans]
MADLVSVRHPATLVTLGLGSCIGLVIFDPSTKVAAMAHIMLPDSRDAKEVPKPGKFADTAVPLLLEHLKNLGAVKGQLKAKMAGGAQMFNIPGKDNSLLAVGSRNVEATTAMLAKHGVPLVASDVGGNKGRSVEFNTETWKLLVKTLGTGSQEL